MLHTDSRRLGIPRRAMLAPALTLVVGTLVSVALWVWLMHAGPHGG